MESSRKISCLIILGVLGSTVRSQSYNEEDIRVLTDANSFLAEKLYKQLSRESGNLIFSPLSIQVALSTLIVGANGETSQELNNTLGYEFAPVYEQALLRGFQRVMTTTQVAPAGYQFNLANAQFHQNSYPFYSNYSASTAQHFNALIRALDFGNKNATLNEINGWINTETNGKITSILQDVTSADVMAQVNAAFFKGQWLHQFEDTETEDVDFFNVNGERKRVQMMSTYLSANYNARSAIAGCAVLELPYKDRTFSMFFVLPELGKSLTEQLENFTHVDLSNLGNDLQPTNMTIGVPKLILQSEVDLIPHLQALGIRNVFSDSADLSRISSNALKVTRAVHKANVELTEEGSETATPTAGISSAGITDPNPYFWLNRPFMFILKHNPTRMIWFMGKVSDV